MRVKNSRYFYAEDGKWLPRAGCSKPKKQSVNFSKKLDIERLKENYENRKMVDSNSGAGFGSG
jgi:hypothetical protein